MSGDPLAALLPADLPQEIIDTYRVRLGLDRSLWGQYLSYMGALVQGDFGYSFRTNGPALDLVMERLGATLILTASALGVAILVGVPAGLLAAVHRNRLPDRAVMSLAVFGFAMPNFFFGILLILLFTLTLQWLPSGGFAGPLHLIMPALTLGLASAGAYARLTRSALLEVLAAPFMETVRAKGMPPGRRIFVHGLRAILVPLVTLLGFSIGALIAGAIVTETVFSWPGIGLLLVISVAERDLAVVQLIVILSAATMATTNALVDLALGWLDPRIGSARRSAG
ncbi:ABC transporter permease [Rhodobacteraceae bacterium CCMM004]|nr:ABC transporter permease [Rhodobacteraceae bacterium CCMM004]